MELPVIKRSFALSVAAFSLLISTGCANGYGGYGAPKQIIIDILNKLAAKINRLSEETSTH